MPDLISAIHGCALQPENWPDALEAMLGHVGGREALLWSHPATPDAFGLRVTCRLPPESLADCVRGFEQHEAWMQAGLAKGLRAGEMLADKHLLLAMLHRQSDTDVMSATPTVCLAMLHGRADAPFGAVERKKLLALLPHLQHATAVNFQLAERDRRLDVAQTAVDLFCDALFFADRSGQIVHANQAARALLAERDGLCLKQRRLLANNPDENRLLQDLFTCRESGVGSRESGVGSRRARCASPARAASRRLWPHA